MIDIPEPEACLSCGRRIGTLNRQVFDGCEACADPFISNEQAPVVTQAAREWLAGHVAQVRARCAHALRRARRDGTMAATRAALAQRIAERERRHV